MNTHTVASIFLALLFAQAGCTSDDVSNAAQSAPPAEDPYYCANDPDGFHQSVVGVDMHNDVVKMIHDVAGDNYDFGQWNEVASTDLPRLRAGGIDVQFFGMHNAMTGEDAVDDHRLVIGEVIELYERLVAENAGELAFVTNGAEALSALEQGKLAGFLTIEGGQVLGADVNEVDYWADRGVFSVCLNHYLDISWGGSRDQDSLGQDSGLTDTGREIIIRMDERGMLVDVAHSGRPTVLDITQLMSERGRPVAATHTGARAIDDITRLLTDEEIVAIAGTGGVVGVMFHTTGYEDPFDVSIARVVDHIEHIAGLVGSEHVGLGSDFGVGTGNWDTGGFYPTGLEDVTKYPELTREMLARGFRCADVENVLGGSVMRMLAEYF